MIRSEVRFARSSAARAPAGALLLLYSLHAATPADYRQKVGVYVWGKLAGGLEVAAADARALGTDNAARVSIGPAISWDPADPHDNSPLDVKVNRPDYRAFLAAFPVVMLTAYDSVSFEKYKWGHLDAEHLAGTRDEFRRFTLELAKTPGRKIISNWEFENDCHADQWAACAEYYQARLGGIMEGRKQARALGSPGEILTAFEFTIVPGFAGKPSGLVEVGAKLKGVDYFSYSSWWSIGWDYDAPTVYKGFVWAIHLIRDFAQKKKLTTRIIIGEFGEYWDVYPRAERMRALVDSSLDNGVEYLFNWVLYDQPGNKDDKGRDASHFGKYALDRTLTPQGTVFRGWFLAGLQKAPPKRKPAPAKTPKSVAAGRQL